MKIVKEYQRNVNQFSTNDNVKGNWLRDLLKNSTTEDFLSKIDKTYLPTADEGYFGGCIYLKNALDGMLCKTMKVFQ